MQNFKKTVKTLVIIVGFVTFIPALGMNGMAQNQQAAQAGQPVCSICGQNNTPIQTITKNNTRTTDNGRWVHVPTFNYNNNMYRSPKYKTKACKNCNSNWCRCYSYQGPSFGYSQQYIPNPTYHNTQCSHVVCTACVTKSRHMQPNANGCNLCPYIQARVQHAHCDLCNNPVDQMHGHESHNHGLCNQHNVETNKLKTHGCNICYAQNNPNIVNQHPQCEAAACANHTDHINVKASCTHSFCDQHHINALQFKYSPIDSIKEMWEGNGCKSCFIRNNPTTTSCETRKRYWGEMALLAGGTSIVVYSVYKIYNWWQDRKQKQEQEQKRKQKQDRKQQQEQADECECCVAT